MKKIFSPAALVALLALAGVTPAVAAALKIGDPAPALQPASWVQGKPVKSFQPGTVYIVEFWATWCGPCRASIPHLNQLWQKFKDKGVVVIGQNIWEPDASAVAPFVKKMGDQMTYRVALDDQRHNPNGVMAETWMKAAGQKGIPTAFIINQKGRIAWIGHPMALNEKLLSDILAGHYNLSRAAADYKQRQQNQQKLMALTKTLSAQLQGQKWDAAEKTLANMKTLLPADERSGLDLLHFEILLGRKDYTAAYKLAASLSDAHPDDVELQNELALFIAAHPGLEKRDLALAEKMANRANQASHGKEPRVLDTLARVEFMNGETNAAMASEQKAVTLADGAIKAQLKSNLTSYRQGQLPDIGE